MSGLARKAFGLLTVLLISGCTVPLYNVKPALNHSSVPSVNEMSVASVGESMLTYTNRVEIDAIRFNEEVTFGPVRNFRFSPGHLVKQGEDEESEFYMRLRIPGATQVRTNPLSQPFSSIQLEKGESRVCAVMVNGGKFCEDDVQYERFTLIGNPSEAVQERLVFLGRTDEVISLQYQEYKGNTAAPGYVENVEFYLDGVSNFEFRNARVEVFNASEESISYVVLQGFHELTAMPDDLPSNQ